MTGPLAPLNSGTPYRAAWHALDLRLTDDEIRSLEDPYVPRLPTYF
ncbi:hypothetical protein [Saccharothrix sp. ALI-22-I]|nr:hypothetical protein [Saccharothrix sp. ALI-22-I]